jgi:hypothetical protein
MSDPDYEVCGQRATLPLKTFICRLPESLSCPPFSRDHFQSSVFDVKAISRRALDEINGASLEINEILERLGSGRFIARIIERLLFTITREHYIACAYSAFSDLNVLIEHAEVTESAVTKFHSLFGAFPEGKWEDSPNRFESQALWTRTPLRVSICTNHIEGLHSKLNAAVKE